LALNGTLTSFPVLSPLVYHSFFQRVVLFRSLPLLSLSFFFLLILYSESNTRCLDSFLPVHPPFWVRFFSQELQSRAPTLAPSFTLFPCGKWFLTCGVPCRLFLQKLPPRFCLPSTGASDRALLQGFLNNFFCPKRGAHSRRIRSRVRISPDSPFYFPL